MDLALEGKVAVVTGASKGIGLAVVRTLAGEGMHVVGGALTVDELDGIAGVTAVALDLVDPAGSARLVDTAVEQHGRIDVLVNNVGFAIQRPFEEVTDEQWDEVWQLNVMSYVRTIRAVLPGMKQRETGTIVNVASVNSFFHPDGLVIDYGAAKAALLNVAKALSQELGPKGIRINSISPGPVATDLWLGEHGVAATIAAATGSTADAVREQALSSMATGRFTTPEEVATLVALLASPRTANVTGSNYIIDGGLIKTM